MFGVIVPVAEETAEFVKGGLSFLAVPPPLQPLSFISTSLPQKRKQLSASSFSPYENKLPSSSLPPPPSPLPPPPPPLPLSLTSAETIKSVDATNASSSSSTSSVKICSLETSDYDCIQRSTTWYDPGCKAGRGEYKMNIISDPNLWNHAVQEQDIFRSTRPRLFRTMNLKLPLFLTIPYWQRHKYSLSDITMQLEFAAPLQVALVSLMLDVPVSNTAVKPCSAAMDALTYGAKAMIMQRVIKHLTDKFPTQQPHPSVLFWRGRLTSIELEDTKIPIPFHSIDPESYQKVQVSLHQAINKGKQQETTWFERPILHFDYVWTWFGEKRFVPLKESSHTWPLIPAKTASDMQIQQEEKTESYIKMGRIVSYDVYLAYFNEHPSIAEMPDIVMVMGEPWCVVSETFFLYSDK